MRDIRMVGGGFLALALLASHAPDVAAAPRALTALRSKLTATGRAEVNVSQVVTSGGETIRRMRGTLALELPDRVRIDDAASGEQLTARGDGGEWLQPAASQMLVLRADQAGQVASVWRLLLDPDQRVAERALGQGRYVLRPRTEDAPVDSVWVRLRADGLPAEVRATAGEERWTLEFGTWAFRKPRGAAAFKLRAPAGYTVLEWP